MFLVSGCVTQQGRAPGFIRGVGGGGGGTLGKEARGHEVDVHGIRDVRAPVRDRPFLGHERLSDEAEEGEHGEAAVLE
eukprot:CAMPEP_0170132830 /NCGR_PEP_ID=MMETSP0033_2-20121228/871_1 /TAXON_ID=195969 /ORGANISM="Dolichomastix tenuilepis, Strain CCMP3274" /LENGTH=77 /DNA_ID=CAMNT_0010368271 /DNA_START=50 /DNA_END=280 /DNA_ORIENTATION=+